MPKIAKDSGPLLKRIVWRILGLFGKTKRWAWNARNIYYAVNHLNKKTPFLISLVEKLVKNGKIVDMGCGLGTLVLTLNPDSYSSYLGIDISDVAIRLASRKAKAQGLTHCQFKVQDMSEWAGDSDVQLILFSESLYYLSFQQQKELLERCLNSLNKEGAVLVVITSKYMHKFRRTLELCKSIGDYTEEITGGRIHIIIKPKYQADAKA